MTDKLIEQIKADREAGTPGPWVDYEFCGDWFVSNGTDDSGPMLRVGSWCGEREANARRIARVPEYEARIEADEQALKEANEVIKAAEALEADVMVVQAYRAQCAHGSVNLSALALKMEAVEKTLDAFNRAMQGRAALTKENNDDE